MVATIQAYAGVLLLLVQLLLSPGLGGRQVNSKVHPKSQKCPQAAKNEKYTTVGKQLYESGDVEAAIACLEAAVEHDQNTLTLVNIAVVYTATSQFNEAEHYLKKARALDPTSSPVLKASFTNTYLQRKYEKSLKFGYKWLEHHPTDVAAHLHVASALFQLQQKLDSLTYYKKALSLEPRNPAALVNAAVILNALGNHSDAAIYSKKAILEQPTLQEAHVTLASALISMKHYQEAVPPLEQAVALRPSDTLARCKQINLRRLLCDWTHYKDDIRTLQDIVQQQVSYSEDFLQSGQLPCHSPGNLLHFPLTLEQHLGVSYLHSASVWRAVETQRQRLGEEVAKVVDWYRLNPKAKLRIGFVSFNYNNHPATHIMLNVFKNIPRMTNAVVYCYYMNSYEDKWTKEVEHVATVFRRVSPLSSSSIAQQIVKDRIGVLVDLMGFTDGGRSEVFALQSAPLQVSYLGFPGTSGAPFMDCILCDRTACDPASADVQFTEDVLYLPEPYFMAPTDVNSVDSSTDWHEMTGLPKGKFVYCCLSQLGKLTLQMFSLWLKILKASSNSILWLIRSPPEAERNIMQSVEDEALKHKIYFTDKMERTKYLSAAPQLCHLFLDTNPYNAHTVAAEMLYGGLPILTLPGKSMASRVAFSLVKSLALEEDLATTSEQDYIDKAVKLQIDERTYKRIKETLLEKTLRKQAPAYNAEQFAANFFQLLTSTWSRKVMSQLPNTSQPRSREDL